MRKIAVFLLMLMLGAGASVHQVAAADKSMVIALPTWTGYGPLFLAKEKGFFSQYGLDVQLSVTQDLSTRKQALAAKRVDAMATALDVQVTVAAAGIPLKVVWALDDSFGGDGILAKNDIKTISDLKGKRIAFLRGSTSHFLLLTALDSVGLSEKDIIPVNMTAGDAGAAFVAGRVDAAVTWEPWLTKGSSGAGHVLVSTKDFPGVIADSISFHADYVKNNPDAVAGFVKAMKDTMEYWKKNPDEGIEIMAKGLGISVDEFKATMEGLKFFDYDDNLAFFGTPEAPGPIFTTMQNAVDFYSELGIIPSKPKASEIIDSQFLQ